MYIRNYVIHAHTHTHARTHMHAHAHTHMHAHTHTHTHTHTHAHTHTHTHTRTHTHTHTHTQAPDTLYSDTAVVKDHVVYFAKSLTGIVHAFDSEKSEWSVLPQCPHTHFTLAVVNGLLTSVGGEESYNTTNKLLSYSNGDSWFEAYLPMSLARRLPAAVSLKEALVVAGGETSLGVATDSVELMSATGLEWCLVASLPRPVSNMTGVACAGGIYLMGGQDQTNKTLSVFWCSLAMLAQSSSSSDAFFPPLSSSVPPGLGFSSYTPPPSLSPWQWLPDAPAFLSTCVLFQGRVVLVGGCDAQYRCTNKVCVN